MRRWCLGVRRIFGISSVTLSLGVFFPVRIFKFFDIVANILQLFGLAFLLLLNRFQLF